MPDTNSGTSISQTLNTYSLEKNVKQLQSSLDSLSSDMGSMNKKVDAIEKRVANVSQELHELTTEFQKMVDTQKKTSNLQRAISELVRVRQEINQKYGNYTVIRQTMIGVLQATDLALVKKTTISRVSEELMLSTPQYWLAPCLVAIAAWISNNRELAERAIAEALKRDEEKTALAMALICRRNGRIQTGYEWLSLYFAKQSATSFTEDSFTYIDAYVNGVFGPDEKHMCQGYVAKWIDEVRGNNSNFESSQEKKWRDFCCKYSRDTDSEFPDLSDSVSEYQNISACIGRIQSISDIRKDFKGITDSYIDLEALRKAVDTQLVRLIGNYDVSEMEIRREEEYLSLVKYYDGDEDRAQAEMKAREAKRLRHKLDFIEQMSNEILSGENTTPSKKKTAVTFLSSYINRGATKYIAEKKENFPDEVTIKLEKWTGKSSSGTEFEQLSTEYEKQMLKARDDAIHYASNTKPRLLFIISIVLLVLAGVTAFFASQLTPILLIVCAVVFSMGVKAKNDIEKQIARINAEYADSIAKGKDKLQRILSQWSDAKDIVSTFDDAVDTKVVA